jgi:histidinol phosphatase-like enzyme (inositol monophosphatase family)
MSYSDKEISELVRFAESLADAAKAETLPRFRNGAEIEDKTGPVFDPVTDADREGERVIRKLIGEAYPGHGIIGEEFGLTEGSEPWRWILDPVDGTRAFVCGVSTWTTLIALEHLEAPIIGLIDQPFTGERWIAANGETVHRIGNVKKICRTSNVKMLSEARISTTDPRESAYFTKSEASAFERVSTQARVARFSMDAYAYGLLALGELDLVLETSLKHHDYAALIPVIENAGGVVTNWRGAPPGTDDRGEIVAAATKELHAAAVKALAG